MMTATAAVATTSGTDAGTANPVEPAWSKPKGPLLDAPTVQGCGVSKNHQ